jgi:preprotein translocase subunit SecG
LAFFTAGVVVIRVFRLLGGSRGRLRSSLSGAASVIIILVVVIVIIVIIIFIWASSSRSALSSSPSSSPAFVGVKRLLSGFLPRRHLTLVFGASVALAAFSRPFGLFGRSIRFQNESYPA